MIDVCEKLNKLVEKVQNSDKEGLSLKIFIAENIMESLKILFKYFNMYIKKNSKKIKNNQSNNNNQLNNNNQKSKKKQNKFDMSFRRLTNEELKKIIEKNI